MKMISRKTILFLVCMSIWAGARAQVVINEYSCSNLDQFVDNHSDFGDWVELHNMGATGANIGGYYLSDDSLNLTRWQFPAGTTIPAGGYLIVWCDGRNEVAGGHYHTNFNLTQTKNNGEYVMLSDASMNIIDYTYMSPNTHLGHSRGRVKDGSPTWAIFVSPTFGATNDTGTPYAGYADRPDYSMVAGFYPTGITVIITNTEPASDIRYTIDGTRPTITSPLYTGPLSIANTTVLKAITYSSDPSILPSRIEFHTYFIGQTHTLPVVSIAGNSLDALANGNGNLEPHGTFELFDTSGVRKSNTYGEFNRHGQDSWALSQRSLDFISRDEMGYNHSVEHPLFSTTTMDNFQRVMLRAAGDDNFPADFKPANSGSAHVRDAYLHNLVLSGGMNMEVRRGSKAIVYLNNIYWGVYDIRDNPDNHDLTKFYYGQDKYNLYMLKRWGNKWSEYGGAAANTDWLNLYNYIMGNSMANPASYQYVYDRLDVASLTDYVLANMFSVCSDWLNWNVCWWRGLDSTGTHLKWGYQLWDNDATWGHYINYTGIPNTTPTASPCDPETLNGNSDPDDHIGVLLALRQNPDFNQFYIARQLDLWNTTFRCDNMLAQFDSTVAVIDPEMTWHSTRWGGTYAQWVQNVADLRAFIVARCTTLIPGWQNCYNLGALHQVTIEAAPKGAGYANLNSLSLQNLPWTGQYFSGIDTKLEAVPTGGNQFSQWTSGAHAFNPSATSIQAAVSLGSTDTIVAHFLTTGVPELLPLDGPLVSASPNLFSDETTIHFSLAEAMPVSIRLYNLMGAEIMQLAAPGGVTMPGNHSVNLNLSGSGLAGGVYLLELRAGKHRKSVRLVYAPER